MIDGRQARVVGWFGLLGGWLVGCGDPAADDGVDPTGGAGGGVSSSVGGSGNLGGDAGGSGASGGAGGSPPGDPEAVPTTEGLVKGYLHGDVWNWRGIPYAAPPVGDLRFRAPRPPAAHEETYDAHSFGDVCVQGDVTTTPYAVEDCLGDVDEPCAPPVKSEDCLSLNIWSRDVDASMPVMVWIHGGGLTVGSSAEAGYMGNKLAHGQGDDVVVVSINYRLGVIGFFGHDGLVGDDPAYHPTTGNYGVLDMVRALEWVRDNIEGFGGDPDNITIFGESGGGTAVMSLLATPLSDGLFHRAIVQSGAYPDAFTQYDLATATELGASFGEHVGCTGDPSAQLGCLRAMDAQALVDAAPSVVGMFHTPNIFFLVQDGFVHDQTVYETFRDTHPKPGIPVLIGTNSDEGFLIGGAIALDTPFLDYNAWLTKRFGSEKATAIGAMYQPAWYPWLTVLVVPQFRAIAEIASDWGFYRSAERFVTHRRDDPANDVYVYHFEVPLSPPWTGPGAPHGTEIVYVFGRHGAPTRNQLAVTSAMQQYWKRFASTGAPDVAALPAWPAFAPGDRPYMAFRDLAEPAVPTGDWLGFTDLGPWRPDGMTKLELIEAWDDVIGEAYSPPLVAW